MQGLKRNSVWKEKSIVATVIMMVAVGIALLLAYMKIGEIIENRCLGRMEEGVNTVIEEVSFKLRQDSRILNAAADMISNAGKFNQEDLQGTLNTVTPLLETMKICILMPDNTIIYPDGSTADATGNISFEEEAPQGEHVSDRMVSVLDGDTLVFRHYVPIEENGETVALLYGVTKLEDLPKAMNIGNIYNGSASVYIIDGKSGEFIMDTWHDTLGSLNGGGDANGKPTAWEQHKDEILSGDTGYVVLYSTRIEDKIYLY